MKNIIFFIIISFVSITTTANEWNIYIDADFSGATASSKAIEMGLQLAMKNNLPRGIDINIITKNHRGNSRRSLANLKEFNNDPKGIAVFCGLHSPPVLANISYINKSKFVLLDPWAAATDITRSPDEDGLNWIFRLSVDDSLAGEFIASSALNIEGYKKPMLIFEDTGWGRANEITFNTTIKNSGLVPPPIIWFNWQLGKLGVKEIVADIIKYDPDVIFLVANTIEGETILKEISNSNLNIPIRSHWGITGGDIFRKLKDELNSNRLDLQFIQTSFLFTNQNLTPYQQRVWKQIRDEYSDIKKTEDLLAPLGFIHGYDLGKILCEALKNIDSKETIEKQRKNLRVELENIKLPIQGLIKEYIRPFSGNNEFYSHEALNISDFSMAEFGNNGEILLIK